MTTYEYILKLREEKILKETQKREILIQIQQQQQNQKQDYQPELSPKLEDNEFKQHKSYAKEYGIENHPSKKFNNQNEENIYTQAFNKGEKIDQGDGLSNSNRTKKQSDCILNQKGRKSNEIQLINSSGNDIEDEDNVSIVNRSLSRLSQIISTRMIFTQKEFSKVSQPGTRKHSTVSFQQDQRINYNQSDNILVHQHIIQSNSQQNIMHKGSFDKKLVQDKTSSSNDGRNISNDIPNKPQKIQSADQKYSQGQMFDKKNSESTSNPIEKDKETKNNIYQNHKKEQEVEVVQQRGVLTMSINDTSIHLDKGGSQFDIQVLDQQGNSFNMNNELNQNEIQLTNDNNQSIDENNQSKDKIILANQQNNIIQDQNNKNKQQINKQ